MKCFVFDIDGTLIDSEFCHTESLYQVLLEQTGKPFDRQAIRQVFGIPSKDALKALHVPDPHGRINQMWGDRFAQLCSVHQKLFDGVVEMLDQLKKWGAILGIVTSKNCQQYESTFHHFGIEHYFDPIIHADMTTRHKPDGEPLEKLLSLVGVEKEETVYIGDMIYDCQCARNAGVKFGLAKWGSCDPTPMDPDYLLENPSDVLQLV